MKFRLEVRTYAKGAVIGAAHEDINEQVADKVLRPVRTGVHSDVRAFPEMYTSYCISLAIHRQLLDREDV